MGYEYKKWVDDMRKLRVNRANLSPELLRTKYADTYGRLRADVRRGCIGMINDAAVGGLPLDAERSTDPEARKETEKLFEAAAKILDTPAAHAAYAAIFRIAEEAHPSPKGVTGEAARPYAVKAAEEAILKALELSDGIFYGPYAEYWLGHCGWIDEEHTWYNSLIGMLWDADAELWRARDGRSVCLMLPPTPELIEKRRKEDGNRAGKQLQEP